MQKVKVGIIGVGNMGSSHFRFFMDNRVPNMELTALCDVDESKMEKPKGIEVPETIKKFTCAEEMMDSGVCEAVIIAVPHYDHPSLVMMALNKGLHAMSEKPAGVYTKQVKEMIECANKSDKVFGMMFNQRTNCVYRKMKELVDNGTVGEIMRTNWIITNWYRTQAYYDSGSWRATWAGEGGGVLLNQCPHNLDLWQWICGKPSKVTAFLHEGKWHDIEVEDDVTAYVEYPNGATGVFVTSTGDYPGTDRFEITGTNGKLVCENNKLTFYKLKENLRENCKTCKEGFANIEYETIEVETDGENEQHVGILKNFGDAILNGTPLIANGVEGIHGLSISNAMHLSSWLSKTIELPFDDELYFEELSKKIKNSKIKADVKSVVLDTDSSYGFNR